MDLGKRLKEIRTQKSLTLRDLEELSSCSANYLSQVERGLNSPTVETLMRITNALGVKLGDFFSHRQIEEPRKIVRKEGRKLAPSSLSGIGYQTLTAPDDQPLLDAFIITLEPGASTGMVAHKQKGNEFLYVLTGRLDLKLNSEVYELHPGDSIRFHSGEPHQIQNNGSVVAEVISVATPPRY